MATVLISRQQFLEDRQGRTFTDVSNDPDQPLDQVLAFLSDADRQRRMEEAEIHHNRPPLAGVVRELESHAEIGRFLGSQDPRRSKRLRQAVGVIVRMIMEQRGWQRTGKKGSLGVRVVAARPSKRPQVHHNTGGLAFWFLRAERYERPDGMPFPTVRQRRSGVESVAAPKPSAD